MITGTQGGGGLGDSTDSIPILSGTAGGGDGYTIGLLGTGGGGGGGVGVGDVTGSMLIPYGTVDGRVGDATGVFGSPSAAKRSRITTDMTPPMVPFHLKDEKGTDLETHFLFDARLQKYTNHTASTFSGQMAGSSSSGQIRQPSQGKMVGSSSSSRQIGYPTHSAGSSTGSLAHMKFKRMVLKISSSGLASGERKVQTEVVTLIASAVAMASQAGVEVAIIVGYKNYFHGETWIDSIGAHISTKGEMGMLASSMNAVLFQAALDQKNVKTRRVNTTKFGKASRLLEEGNVVIFDGIGTAPGSLFITADEVAVSKACEMKAQTIFIVMESNDYRTRCVGCLNKHVTFSQCLLDEQFRGMGQKALINCQKHNISVFIFDYSYISNALFGDLKFGTFISSIDQGLSAELHMHQKPDEGLEAVMEANPKLT